MTPRKFLIASLCGLATSCIGLCIGPSAVAAQTGFADLASIDRAVENFTGSPVGTPGGARGLVDRRMKLAPCPAPLALGYYGQARDTIRVECPVQGGWRIFVSLTASAQAQAQAQAQEVIARGDRVSIAVEGRGFSVAQSGEAMEAGAIGDWIRVKPPGQAEPVKAKVSRPGLVTIPLF